MTARPQLKGLGRANWLRYSVFAVVASTVGWFVAPNPTDPPTLVQSRRDDWSQDLVPRRIDGAALAARLMASSLWGEVAQIKVAPTPLPPDERWRLAAVVDQGVNRFVLVTFADPSRPAQRFRVGEDLPGGYKITSIEGREVCVRIGKRSHRLGIERLES